MKPLEGIRVLDFSRVLAGPMATQILAELGADVIKIERPGSGDEARQFEPRWPAGNSAYFSTFNRGKRSVTLDLKSVRGREIALALIERADVLVENMLPGRMARMGLGPEQARARNPGLIYISNTGFGQTGPEADKPGYDTIFQALSGIMALTGHPDGPPAKVGVPFADLSSGLWIVIAALSAIAGRARSGHGAHVDLAMMDVQSSLMSIPAARHFALGEEPARTGTGHAGRVPSAAYQCADGGWIQISASDQHWPKLCEALALADLAADDTLARNAGRLNARARVDAGIGAAVAGLTREEAVARLAEAGVPAGPILTLSEALTTDQAKARDRVVTVQDPQAGPVPGLRTPPRFDGYDDPEPLPPPQLGDATDAVLGEDLGLSQAEIARLREEGVI